MMKQWRPGDGRFFVGTPGRAGYNPSWLGGQESWEKAMEESPEPATQSWNSMFLGKVVHRLLRDCGATVLHLETGSVLSDPEVEVGLGATTKASQDLGGPDSLDHGQVDT